MKVWLVEVGEYEQSYVAGVFSSLELAKAYVAANQSRCGICVYGGADDDGFVVDDKHER